MKRQQGPAFQSDSSTGQTNVCYLFELKPAEDRSVSRHPKVHTDGRRVTNLLEQLVAIHSVNPSFPAGEGELQMAEWLASHCDTAGLEVEVDEVLPGRPNVLARLRAETSRGVLLFESHLDTVSFGTDEMERPVIRGGRLYGRGACDTKGSLAAMLVALERLMDRTDELSADVLLLGAVDEERAGLGAHHFVASGGHADGAIIGEPTSLEIVVAHKGCVRFRLTTRGRAAHSSESGDGDNAIYAMSDVIQHLRSNLFPKARHRKHPLVGTPTWSVGLVRGGAAVNIVPDECTIDIDYRSIPGETPEWVLAEVDNSLDVLRASNPNLKVERAVPFMTSFPLHTPASEPVTTAAITARSQVLGPMPAIGVAYGSDASLLATYGGIPSVVVGPGDIGVAHGPDEYVDLEELHRAVDLYEAIALAFDPDSAKEATL